MQETPYSHYDSQVCSELYLHRSMHPPSPHISVGRSPFPRKPWLRKSPVCRTRFPSASIRDIWASYAEWSTNSGVIAISPITIVYGASKVRFRSTNSTGNFRVRLLSRFRISLDAFPIYSGISGFTISISPITVL